MFGTGAASTMLDEFISSAEREEYLLQLYIRGEISGSCSFVGGRPKIEARCLTPYGMLKLEEYAARFDAQSPPAIRLQGRRDGD